MLFTVASVLRRLRGPDGREGDRAPDHGWCGRHARPGDGRAAGGGVSVIMTNTETLDTVLFSMERMVSSASAAFFTFLTVAVNIPLGALIPVELRPRRAGHAAARATGGLRGQPGDDDHRVDRRSRPGADDPHRPASSWSAGSRSPKVGYSNSTCASRGRCCSRSSSPRRRPIGLAATFRLKAAWLRHPTPLRHLPVRREFRRDPCSSQRFSRPAHRSALRAAGPGVLLLSALLAGCQRRVEAPAPEIRPVRAVKLPSRATPAPRWP